MHGGQSTIHDNKQDPLSELKSLRASCRLEECLTCFILYNLADSSRLEWPKTEQKWWVAHTQRCSQQKGVYMCTRTSVSLWLIHSLSWWLDLQPPLLLILNYAVLQVPIKMQLLYKGKVRHPSIFYTRLIQLRVAGGVVCLIKPSTTTVHLKLCNHRPPHVTFHTEEA